MSKSSSGSGTEKAGQFDAPNNIDCGDVLADEDTAELPVLDLSDCAGASPMPDDTGGDLPVARAAAWVGNVEAEIERLRNRWSRLDETIASANDRAATLQADCDAKDARIAELTDELAAVRDTVAARDAAIAERDDAIGAGERVCAERDAALVSATSALQESTSRAAVLEDRLTAARDELDELRGTLENERSAAAELRVANAAATEAQIDLRAKLAALESYVDGRRDRWVEQQAQIQAQEERLSSFASALAEAERRIAERESQIGELHVRVRELTRELGEAEGRYNEREAAVQESRAAAREQVAEIERLQLEIANRGTGVDRAAETVTEQRERIAALEAALAEKTEMLSRLDTDLGKLEAVRAHVETERHDDRKRIGDLQEALAAIKSERDALSESLATATARASSLDEQLADSERARAALANESEARRLRVGELEAALEQRSEVLGGLDANFGRLVDLNRSLAEVDGQPIANESDPRTAPQTARKSRSLTLVDAVMLFGGDDAPEHIETQTDFTTRDPPRANRGQDPSDDSVLAKIRGQAQHDAKRRAALVRMTDDNDDHTVFVLTKPATTIGRSYASDIRVDDAVVSRQHARLHVADEIVTIEDLGSKNGLIVNGKIIKHAVLAHGDVVSIGCQNFRFVVVEPPVRTH